MLNNNINVVASIDQADVNTGWIYTQSSGTIIPTNQTPTIIYDENTGVLRLTVHLPLAVSRVRVVLNDMGKKPRNRKLEDWWRKTEHRTDPSDTVCRIV